MLHRILVATLMLTSSAYANEMPSGAPEEKPSTPVEAVDWINEHQFQARISPLSIIGNVINPHFAFVTGRRFAIGLDLAYEFRDGLTTWGLTQGKWAAPTTVRSGGQPSPYRSRYLIQADYYWNDSSERSWILSPYLGLLGRNFGPASDGYVVGLTATHQWIFEDGWVLRGGAGLQWLNPVALGFGATVLPVVDLSVGYAF
jgi:hypothetical protein